MDVAALVGLFVLGLAVGSFLNVCIYRLPRRESLNWPASHCTTLQPRLCRGTRTSRLRAGSCFVAAVAPAARRSASPIRS